MTPWYFVTAVLGNFFFCRGTLEEWRPHTRYATDLWPQLWPIWVLWVTESQLNWKRKTANSVSPAGTLQRTYHSTAICLHVFYRGADKSLARPGRKKSYSDRRFWFSYIPFIIIIGGILVLFYLYIYIYRVSQEEWTKLRESVLYVELYRYNPKHLYPKLNGYGDNGHRKVWASGVSTYCTPSVTPCSSSAHARQPDTAS